MKKLLGMIALSFLAYTLPAKAHCEIPCGIYDDKLRIKLLYEHTKTMEKSIKMIKELSSKNDPLSKNQLVRWIMNKEKHAKKFQHIVWQYFLTQRVKPVDPSDKEKYKLYLKKLEVLHQLSFYAMKAKQSVDEKYIHKLRELIKKFEELYWKEHGHKH
ncbi:superoxide dismutase [Ni] [Aquifex sp.]